MKSSRFVALALVAALLVSGCSMLGVAGRETRENVLPPLVAEAWPCVEADVVRGINDARNEFDIEIDTAAEAVRRTGEWSMAVAVGEAGPIVELYRRDWARFSYYADRGIADRVDDNEIGPGVAESRLERVRKFGEVLRVMSGEPTEPE